MFKKIYNSAVSWFMELYKQAPSNAIDSEEITESDLTKLTVLLAKNNNVKCTVRDNDHITLEKDFVVSYWPNSKNKTAYLHGSPKGVRNISPKNAVSMTIK